MASLALCGKGVLWYLLIHMRWSTKETTHTQYLCHLSSFNSAALFSGSVNITRSPFNYNPQGTNYWLGCASLWKNFPFSTLSLTCTQTPHQAIIFFSFYPGKGGTWCLNRLTPQRQVIIPYLFFIWMFYYSTRLVMTHSSLQECFPNKKEVGEEWVFCFSRLQPMDISF